jgi:endoglucanase
MQRAAQSPEMLKSGWNQYVRDFIREDGRVIDYRAGSITTSEGQAYAMLRSVWMNDRTTFDKTYAWAVRNLNRGVRADRLWAWKWGQDSKGGAARVLDKAFASDADQDVALSLILAYELWKERRYLDDALAIAADLWNIGTVEAGGRRYLLAGDTLCQGNTCRINPSYYAPYIYRILAKYDRGRDWNQLVVASYDVLEAASGLTTTRLPPDWLHLDKRSGALTLAEEKDSRFSYDAFRVYWRIAMDRELYREARADRYLKSSLAWALDYWRRNQNLPAVISKDGRAEANYEAPEMLAGLSSAARLVEPAIGAAMYERLEKSFANGSWAEKDSYYIQNWAWFGTALHLRFLSPFEGVV